MQVAASRKWAGSTEQLRWESMVKASAAAIGEGYKGQLTDYLGTPHVQVALEQRLGGDRRRAPRP